jgi:hypothetical protein
MTASRVQGKIGLTAGTSTNTQTLNAPATLGNIIVVGVRANNSVTINTPTDDKSHTYLAATAQISSGAARVRMWYAVQTTGGMTQVTVTTSGTATIDMAVEEYAGVQRNSPLGNVSSGTGTTETSWSVASFSPTATGNLIVVFGGGLFAGAVDFTAGSNYTLGLDGVTAATEHRLVSADPETAPLTAGTAPTAWAEVAAELKAAVAATASLSGAGSFSASVTINTPVTASISGVGSLSGAVTLSVPVNASLAGVGSISGDVTLTIPLGAALAGAGGLSGSLEGGAVDIAAALAGVGSLTADVTVSVPVTLALSSAGSQTAALTVSVPLGAVLQGAGDAAASVTMTVPLTGALGGGSGIDGNPTIFTPIAAVLSGTGGFFASFASAITPDWVFSARLRVQLFAAPERVINFAGRFRPTQFGTRRRDH